MTILSPTTFLSRKSWAGHLKELWHYRDLIRNLVVRDLKVRYKHSVLGILWSLLNPLLMMLIFSFVFTVMQPNNIPHFYVFILAGLIPWNLFSGSVLGASTQVIGNAHLINKVYFPREVLPLATVLSTFVNFMLSLIPLFFFLIYSGIGFTQHLLWLPVIMAIQLLLVLGLGFFLSAFAVFYRDAIMVLDVVILGLFFMTPIFYPMELIQREATIFNVTLPIYRMVRWLNPMASLIDSYRTVIYGVIEYSPTGQPIYYPPSAPALDFMLRTGVTALIVFMVGWAFFRLVSPRFGEEA